MNLPNRITLGRLFIALVFFFALGYYRLQVIFQWNPLRLPEQLTLNLSLFLFGLAVVTDAVDGYYARKLGQVTVFGRIADPFVDKVVVSGAFIFLSAMHHELRDLVWPSMVILIMGREYLVTSVRGLMESEGQDFSAEWSGKLKMVVQSSTIAWILFYKANLWPATGPDSEFGFRWARNIAIILLWATLITTLASGVHSLLRARKRLLADF